MTWPRDRNPRISGCDTDIGAYEVQLASLDAPQYPSGEAGYEKNKYISFDPGNGGQYTALRVVMTATQDTRFDHQVGWHWWVGPPETYCEHAGVAQAPDCQTCVGGLPEIDFTGAQLQCQPHYMDWSTVGTVHVFGVEIIPHSTYEVQVIEYGCKLGAEDDYSDPQGEQWGHSIFCLRLVLIQYEVVSMSRNASGGGWHLLPRHQRRKQSAKGRKKKNAPFPSHLMGDAGLEPTTSSL